MEQINLLNMLSESGDLPAEVTKNWPQSLERLQQSVYESWLKDSDKREEYILILTILVKISQAESLEFFFKDDRSQAIFLNKFTKEVINIILKQNIVSGEKGDEIALEVLIAYVIIFLRFLPITHRNPSYLSFFESIKEIFDGSRSFYRGISSLNSPKNMSPENFNVISRFL
jgi:hypothetical protein